MKTISNFSWLTLLSRTWMGYDFFISYSHEDGGKYARTLAQTLVDQDFTVFLDEYELHGGGLLSFVVEASLHRTKCLLVIGTRAATKSEWVKKEIKLFSNTQRVIIPIDIHRIRHVQAWFPPDDEHFLEEENNASLPSNTVLEHVVSGRRKNRILVRARWITGLVLVTLVLLATSALFIHQIAKTEEKRTQIRDISLSIDRARRLLPSSETGWIQLNQAAKSCQQLKTSEFPVALAALLAYKGTRDFSRISPESLQPGVRRVHYVSKLPSAGRAVAWLGESIVFQDKTSQLYRWEPPNSPVPYAEHPKSSNSSSNIGQILIKNDGILHTHNDGLYLWSHQKDELLVSGNIAAFAENSWIIDGKLMISGNPIEIAEPQSRVAALGNVWMSSSRSGKLKLSSGKSYNFGMPILASDIYPGDYPAFVAGGGDGRIRIYLDGGKDISLTGHVGTVTVVKFGDSKLLSAGADGTIRLWDWELGEEQLRLVGPQLQVNAAALSPDGNKIAASYSDGSIRLWHSNNELIRQDNNSIQISTQENEDWQISTFKEELIVSHELGEVARWYIPNLGKIERIKDSIDLLRTLPDGTRERWHLSEALKILDALGNRE